MKERKGFYIRLTEEEVKMIADLKAYAVNVTRLIKNSLKEHHRQVCGGRK